MQRVEKSIRVKSPAAQAYQFWRDFRNFPRFMDHVEEVTCLDSGCQQSHWQIRGPLGKTVEYDAAMTQDAPNESIAWNSTTGDIETTGQVTFTDQGDNTLVHVILQWTGAPGGPFGEAAAHIFDNPAAMVEEDLQRFKDIVEGRVGSGLRR